MARLGENKSGTLNGITTTHTHTHTHTPVYSQYTTRARDCSSTVSVAGFSARQVTLVPSSGGSGFKVSVEVVTLPSLVVCSEERRGRGRVSEEKEEGKKDEREEMLVQGKS